MGQCRSPTSADGDNKKCCDFFRLLAFFSCVVSLLTLFVLAISMPLFLSQISADRADIAAKSDKFKHNTNRIWNRLHPLPPVEEPTQAGNSAGRPSYYLSRRMERSVSSPMIGTANCVQLSCPAGPSGPAGPPGEDSSPGEPGKPGAPGDDGMDIIVESELDLPCSVCPGGPPGQRGTQGERGQMGSVGAAGEPGPDGKQGPIGAPGALGPRGFPGEKGEPGHPGQAGDQVIAGVGVKGPKGRTGPAGPTGPPGLRGKANMQPGEPGPAGPQGGPGPAGKCGSWGEQGPAGAPGEPGPPSTYCASDCGVSHIKVPGPQNYARQADEQQQQQREEEIAEQKIIANAKERAEIRRHPVREEKPEEIRRHPNGGYYRRD